MVIPSEGRRPTASPTYPPLGTRLSTLECRAAVRMAEDDPKRTVGFIAGLCVSLWDMLSHERFH